MILGFLAFALVCYGIALSTYEDARRDGYEHTDPDDMPAAAQIFFTYGALCFFAGIVFTLLFFWYLVDWLLA